MKTGDWYRKLDADRATAAVELYEAGASCGQIATLMGVSRQGMWDLLRRRTAMRAERSHRNPFDRGGAHASKQAHYIVARAVELGVLAAHDECSECGTVPRAYRDGRRAIAAHHDDYNEPLVVRWLCRKCHYAWHQENEAVMLHA